MRKKYGTVGRIMARILAMGLVTLIAASLLGIAGAGANTVVSVPYSDDFSTDTVSGNWEWVGLGGCPGWSSGVHSISWNPEGHIDAVESSGCYVSGFKLKGKTFGDGTFSVKAMARHQYHANSLLAFIIDSSNWIQFGYSRTNGFIAVGKSASGSVTPYVFREDFPTNLNQYYEISVKREGSRFTFYIDGKEKWSGEINDPVFSGPLPIGIAVYGNTVTTPFYFDDLKFVPSGTGAVIPTTSNGLVAEYHFDGDSKDSSGNGNHGTINGATFVQGINGQALSFDGVDDYVAVPDSASLDITKAITIEAWVNANSFSNSFTVIVDKGQQWSLFIDSTGHLSSDHQGITPVRIASASLLSKGTWHYVVDTYDGITRKLYIDGYQVESEVSSGSILTDNYPFLIGADSPSVFRFFDGKMDEVRIYNRALSASEIQTEYNAYASTTTPIPITSKAGMVAEYHFDGDAIDSSGNGNHGKLKNGAAFSMGIKGQALSLDGIDDWVLVESSQSLSPSQEITLEAWIKPKDITKHQGIIWKEYSGPKYALVLNKEGKVGAAISSDNWKWESIESKTTALKENWNHVVFTFDGTREIVYLNGKKDAEILYSGDLYSSPVPMGIGAWYNGGGLSYPFNGLIDEVRIYNHALSASEIQAEYNAYLPTITPSPATPPPTTYASQPTVTQSATSPMKQPLLTISQTSLKEEPEVGEEVLITVTLQNSGEASAKNIRLTEQIPSSIAVSFVDGANKPGNLVTWEGELKPNRAHTITHTVKILEEKGRAIPVIIKYEDEEGNPKETSTTVYVDAKPHATPAPTPVWTKEEPRDVNVKLPGFTAPIVLMGLLAAILLTRRR